MKIRRVYLYFLCLMLLSFLSITVDAAVQTTFTKIGNEITVIIKPDQTYSNVGFSGFNATFRYLNTYGVTLTVTQSTYTAVTLDNSYLDPTDANYRLAVFGFTNFNPPSSSFTSGAEYSVFKFQISGGTGNGTFALVEDSPIYQYAYSYIEFNQGTDVTNKVDPFYAGSHGLSITTKVVGSNTWKYATESNSWLSTAASTAWNTGSNWSNAVVPIAADNVIINNGTNQPVITTTAVIINNLTLQNNATIEIEYDATLTVSGSITQGTGNKIIIKSTNAGTGSLIHNTAGINGELQRYLKGWGSYSGLLKNGHGWHLLSSPVASQLNAPFQDLADNDDFLKWNEVVNAWENRRRPDNTLNPAFETTFTVGKGYLVAYEDNKTNLFQGVLNVSNVSVSGLTNSWTSGPVNYYGHHLLGNPFSSALQWGTGAWSRTNVASHVQIWNEVNASYTVIGDGDPIPAMQGFFVYTPGSGSLTIPSSARIHSAQPFYKSADDQILLVARDLDHQMLQESKVSFNAGATALFDLEYDSYYMAGYAPTFYSVSNGEAFALNTLPEASADLTIPFVFVKNDGTNFSISLEENIEGATIYLVDLKANQTVNLTEVNQYSFVSMEGDNPDRFLLKFSPVGINDVISSTSVNIFTYGNTLYLNSTQYSGNTVVSVFDMLGREILQKQLTLDGQTAIDLSGFNGAYIVRAVTDREVVSKKVYLR